MALFDWKDSFSMNIKAVDEQHKMLIQTLNELHEAMLTGQAREVISGILKSLEDYTQVHFSYEEELMKRYNYPDFAKHKKEHDAFTQKVGEFIGKYQKGHLMLSLEVMNFLKDWLKNHIMGVDKGYSSFLNEKGVV